MQLRFRRIRVARRRSASSPTSALTHVSPYHRSISISCLCSSHPDSLNILEMTEPAPSKNDPTITAPPRVYYLPDAQGRMASYYNTMELPENYTTNHGIPRTNHFVPVGYCCLADIAPRPVSSRYKGSNPRSVEREEIWRMSD